MSFLSLPLLAFFLLIGALAGLLAGLLGIGGGIVMIPLFLWIFPLAGFAPETVVHAAFGTSLAVIIPTAASSALAHRRRGNVDWHQVFRLSLGGIMGAVLGGTLAVELGGEWLKGAFGLMQIAVGLRLFLHPRHLPPERETPPPCRQLLLVGFATGVFSSFFGVGGGFVAVPLMVIFLQLPVHLAVGNSSALIATSSVFGTISYIVHGWGEPGLPAFSAGYVNLLVFLLVAPGAIFAARMGVGIAGRIDGDTLMKSFSVFIILVGVRIAATTFL